MQPSEERCKIERSMKKGIKILITFLIILLPLTPAVFFLIYPNINNLVLAKNSLNIYEISKETTLSSLTRISPIKEKYSEEVLGYTSIEEYVQKHEIDLQDMILEKLGAKLTIDSVNIEGKIHQGENSLTMDKGFWHFPISSFPGERGNTVIIGHRFMNLPPSKDTFFNLDKVGLGDSIVVTHKEGSFTYNVVDIKEVSPNDISILKDTSDYRLTLITCTPLWTSEKRLVITAKLDKLYKKV